MIQSSLRDVGNINGVVPALKGRPKFMRRYAAKNVMQSIFGPNGLIAKAHPEYEHRPGQIDMAEAVLRAFEQKQHLIVEAGTGTGKTLAYLVPAIAAACGSGARIVISTGTKNLQEQLMDKDIPFLQEILPQKFRAAAFKGRNNNPCLPRLMRAETAQVLAVLP